MRLIRPLTAVALLKVGQWMLDRADGLRPARAAPVFGAPFARGPLPEPAEKDQPAGCSFAAQILLGSIVGLAICTIWIWIVARAGR